MNIFGFPVKTTKLFDKPLELAIRPMCSCSRPSEYDMRVEGKVVGYVCKTCWEVFLDASLGESYEE